MPIPFECTMCGLKGNANDFFVGRRGTCSCGNILDFIDAEPVTALAVGKIENGSVTDKRTGVDRRVEQRSFEGSDRRGDDRRTS